MNKYDAISILGGTTKAAADALNLTQRAVLAFSDPLPTKTADHVVNTAYRLGNIKQKQYLELVRSLCGRQRVA